ncbi:MAG: NAD(P)H-hydrate dehydratase [Bacteroidetes bacterium]|nr:NAD(P)H-hydrate dehydratase [Bacteroidota bacterium]
MKIFNAEQISKWDADTIREQQILSIDLMERAAKCCYDWLLTNGFAQNQFHIFCGKGNNGGDGLALAALLLQNKIKVTVYILETGKAGTLDFQKNLQRLHKLTTAIHFIQEGFTMPSFGNDTVIVDAVFGTGLNKPPAGIAGKLIEQINSLHHPVISIDIPSGMFADKSSKNNPVITANCTLSFQQYKMAFLFPENEKYTGQVYLMDIGLSRKFEEASSSVYELMEPGLIKALIRQRSKFSHKGNFGHAALVAGSYGMMGAAVLSAKACMASGVGKLTAVIPACGYDILQTAIPEAMCAVAGSTHINEAIHLQGFTALGIGPGINTNPETRNMLFHLLSNIDRPLLMDADALNLIAMENASNKIPKGAVITPHPKEFDTLFGKTANDFDRLQLAIKKAASLHIYIVLKGHYTAMITPFGKVYFNNTGNAGMAKAGMGDVLTGIITGLLAQGYVLPEAALIGTWLHGLAGDVAASRFSMEAMQASDLVQCISEAWTLIKNYSSE